MPLLPASFTGAPRRRARIEIIPLIDVIFFLLATFVLFTLSLNQSGGLAIALPAAGTGMPRDPRGAVTITLQADGSLAWDKLRCRSTSSSPASEFTSRRHRTRACS